jgi:hypothetical protein
MTCKTAHLILINKDNAGTTFFIADVPCFTIYRNSVFGTELPDERERERERERVSEMGLCKPVLSMFQDVLLEKRATLIVSWNA